MKNYLAFDKLREDGMNLLEKYSNLLDQDHHITFAGLLKTEHTLAIDSETFGNDVCYYLNLIIEILTSYEDVMDKKDQEIFDDICTMSLQIDELSSYKVGMLIVHDNLPYQVMDVDFDDITLCLGNGEENEIWIEVNELN
jgi:hypothetical protein